MKTIRSFLKRFRLLNNIVKVKTSKRRHNKSNKRSNVKYTLRKKTKLNIQQVIKLIN